MLRLARTLTLGAIRGMASFINKFSISFDGIQENLQTTADDTLQDTTYSFWAKSSTNTTNQGVFGHGGSSVGAFHFKGDGSRPLLWLGGSNFIYWLYSSAQDDGEWNHWVVYADTNDITNSKLYVNGVLQTVSFTSTGSSNTYTEPLTIGADKQNGGNHFEGQIDEFAVYHKELSQAEIDVLYNTYYGDNIVQNGDFEEEGAEEVTNGDFSSDSDWNTGGGTFEITNGRLHCVSDGSYQYAGQGSVFVVGKIYKVTFDIVDYTSGSIRIRPSGQTPFNTYNSNGTYTEYITATNATLVIERNSACDLFIDNVSVKEVGQDWTFGTGWSTADGVAICDGSQTSNSNLLQNTGLQTVGKTFKISYKVSNYSSGAAFIGMGGYNYAAIDITEDGQFTQDITVTNASSNTNFYVTATSDFSATIDNIVVEELKHKATNLLKDSGDYTSSADLENYYRMGDGKLDSYPLIADQTNPTLGAELVTSWSNSDFSSFASSGSDITEMVSSGSGNNNYSPVTIISGKTYKLQFTSSQAISCQIRISPNTFLTSADLLLTSVVLGLNEVVFSASSDYDYIGFRATSSFTDTQISDFTLKEVNGNPAIMTNMSSGNILQDTPVTS